MITLAGARGTGRSSLAHTYAQLRGAELSGGVWSCSLGHAADPDAMWLRLALSFDVELAGGSRSQTFARALSCLGPSLFILDGADRVRAPLAAALEKITVLAPHALFLVVASKALQVHSERAIDVACLSPEAAKDMLAARVEQTAARLPMSAFERFIDASGGNPLALELLVGACAARVAAGSSWVDIDRTVRGQREQVGRGSDALPLSAADTALGALPVELHRVMIQCASFRSSFDVDAAQAVIETDGSVEPSLSTLATCHLLRRRRDRYSMHPLVRKACAAALGADQEVKRRARDAMQRHGELYALLGSEASLGALQRAGGKHWARYVRDVDELTAAYERAMRRQDAPTAGACGLALAVVEGRHGNPSSASSRLVAALTLRELGDRTRLRASIARAEALLDDGRIDTAVRVLGETAKLAHEVGDQRALAATMLALGRAQLGQGRIDEARRAIDEAYLIGGDINDKVLRSESAALLAKVRLAERDTPGAILLLEEARAIHGPAGASRSAAYALTELAELLDANGDRKRAKTVASEAQEVVRRLGDRATEARTLGSLGVLALGAGQVQRAAALLENAAARSRELGTRALEARWRAALAETWVGWGWNDRALKGFRDAEQLAREASPHGSLVLVEVLWRRAKHAKTSGQDEHYRRLVAEIEMLLPDLPMPDPRLAAALRGMLGYAAPKGEA